MSLHMAMLVDNYIQNLHFFAKKNDRTAAD
jgi:hypothetical protein